MRALTPREAATYIARRVMGIPIDRVEGLSVDEFHSRYSDEERPVVLRGAIRDWTAFKSWSPEHLKSVLGATPVKVARSPDGGEYFDPETGVDHTRTLTLPFDEFIDRAFPSGASGTREKLYLLQASTKDFRALEHDVVVPEYVRRPLVASNLWIGSEGNITRCHYDMQDNLLAQVVGRKRVALFSSHDMRRLYPRSRFGNKSNFSRVDVVNPDLQRFPRFRGVIAYEAELSPGDMLYIPIHWFHHVVSVDASISINYWWQPRVAQSLRPAALWYWPRMAADGYLAREIVSLARRTVKATSEPR